MLRDTFIIGAMFALPSSSLMIFLLVVCAVVTLGSVGVIIVRGGSVFAGIDTLGSLEVIVTGAGNFGELGSCCVIVVAKISASVRSTVSCLSLTGVNGVDW